jgi:dipeptidyl aminopeptidase/acylaminoacyl peptidase
VTYIDRNKGWNLMRLPLAGGPPEILSRFAEGRASEFAWSPDGESIAVVRQIGRKTGLWLVQPGKPGKSESRLLIEFPTGAITNLRWTKDSKNVVYVYGTTSKDVAIMTGFS